MFTGLIEDVGTLVARRPAGRAAKLEVRTQLPGADLQHGDSLAVNGACLTVEQIHADQGLVVFHTLTETLQRTNLSSRPLGSLVNLERALCLGQRLGGHLVQGHVDATSRIMTIGRTDDDIVVKLELPDALKPLLIPKGSVAVDGISLTVALLEPEAFTVRIIPHTWESTNLRQAQVGDEVNLEGDMVGKYILRREQLAADPDVSLEDLHRAGFA